MISHTCRLRPGCHTIQRPTRPFVNWRSLYEPQFTNARASGAGQKVQLDVAIGGQDLGGEIG
jgi:hypothetical protein